MTAPIDTPVEKVNSPSATSVTPERARAVRVEAAEADSRAAEAQAVADRAKTMAKKARAEAMKSTVKAQKLRASIEPVKKENELTPAQAKLRFLEAARRIHPLASAQATVKEHPFATVGIAAGTGLVLGSTSGFVGTLIGSSARIAAALLGLARPLLLAAGKFAAAQAMAKQAAHAVSPTPATPSEMPAEAYASQP